MSAITLLVFLIFFIGVIENNQKIHIPKYLWYYMAFVLYTILSDVILVGKTINIKYLYSNYMITAILSLIMIENTFVTTKFLKVLNRLAFFIVMVAFVTILIQQFYKADFFVDLNKENVFDFLNTIDSGQRLPSIYSWIGLLEVGFSFLPFLAILIDKSLYKKKVYLWGLFIIGFIFVLFTKNRWVMVNYIILLLIPFVFFRKSLGKLVLNTMLISLVVVFSLSISSYFGAPVYDIIENRILEKSKGGLEQGSASTRILAFYVFGQLYPEHPIFGKGDFHAFDVRTDKDYELAKQLGGRSSQIHVGYLSLLYYYGLVGGALFILALYHLMKRLYTRARLSKHWATYFSVLGFVLANFTLVDFNLFHAGLLIIIVYDNFYFNEYLTKSLVFNNKINNKKSLSIFYK